MNPIKKLPFTANTLVELGITKSILQYRFKEWLEDPNYRVDLERKVIYVGISTLHKEIKDRSNLMISLGRKKDLEGLMAEIREEKKRMEDLTRNLTENQKKEFFLRVMEESSRKAEEADNELYDEMYKMASDPNYIPPVLDSPEPQPQELNKNPYPNIFVGTDSTNFELFMRFIDENIVDPYIDFSFIFSQMKEEKRIHRVYNMAFAEWLHESGFISERIYQDIASKGQFRALSKTASGHRLNIYFNIKKELGIR